MGTEDSPEDGEDPESEVDKETIHRLCPTYATDINSPLRHVRTRIYFTSESHVHSLINVLRFSHLAGEYWHSCIPLLQLMYSTLPLSPTYMSSSMCSGSAIWQVHVGTLYVTCCSLCTSAVRDNWLLIC